MKDDDEGVVPVASVKLVEGVYGVPGYGLVYRAWSGGWIAKPVHGTVADGLGFLSESKPKSTKRKAIIALMKQAS